MRDKSGCHVVFEETTESVCCLTHMFLSESYICSLVEILLWTFFLFLLLYNILSTKLVFFKLMNFFQLSL